MNRAYFQGLKVVAQQKAEGLLLDLYPADAAYSFRKLRSNYTGAAIRVRRSSDDAEQDIGFDANNDLDTASLLSFVGSGDGFVTTFYNQGSGTSNAVNTQNVRQSRIVIAGILQTKNSKPASITPDVNNGNNRYNFNSNNINTVSLVYSRNNVNTVDYLSGLDIGGGVYAGGSATGFNGFGFFDSSNALNSNLGDDFNQHISIFSTKKTNNAFFLVDNSSEINAGTIIGSEFNFRSLLSRFDLTGNNITFIGFFQEAVFFSEDHTNDLAGIRNNINNYYNVF